MGHSPPGVAPALQKPLLRGAEDTWIRGHGRGGSSLAPAPDGPQFLVATPRTMLHGQLTAGTDSLARSPPHVLAGHLVTFMTLGQFLLLGLTVT